MHSGKQDQRMKERDEKEKEIQRGDPPCAESLKWLTFVCN